MRIRALNIKHFRVFRDFWFIPNQSVNVVIGPNNIGKTAMLEALRLALDPGVRHYRDDVLTRFDFHNQKLDEPIQIHVWLSPEQDEPDEMKLAYFDKLTKWSVDEKSACVSPVTVNPMDGPEDVEKHEELVCVRVHAEWDDTRQVAVVEHAVVDEVGAPRWTLSYSQRELVDYRHFGSRRDPLRELSLSPRSSLARNLDEKQMAEAFRDILKALEGERSRILETETLSGLLQRLNDLVSPEVLRSVMYEPGSQFTATFLEEGLMQLRRAATLATVGDASSAEDAGRLPLSRQGDGMQNLLLLVYLIDALRESGSASIVALEEPEQNLEPPLARWVFSKLIDVSKGDAKTASDDEEAALGGQVFITTHSPVLVSEADGAEHLVIMERALALPRAAVPEEETSRAPRGDEDTDGNHNAEMITALTCSRLDKTTRKSLERNSHLYANALFARHVLIVEGDSEVGFLPTAFRHLASGEPGHNPFHMGLEIIPATGKGGAPGHALTLSACGKLCHILLDRDAEPDDPQMKKLIEKAKESAEFVSSWSRAELLPFVGKCDLEVVLTAQVAPEVLFEAIRGCYEDAGHDLNPDEWTKACELIEDDGIRQAVPEKFPELEGWSIESLHKDENCTTDVCRRAFVYAALHGPHECKSVKDMRTIAQHLARHNAIPLLVEQLRRRIVAMITHPDEFEKADVYLAT